MRLQSDPTVIYGLGPRYDGEIHTRDLLTDTPYNTYTRAGLPPTPIALPGRASLMAAVHPEETGELYFVATGLGDGAHQFSKTLEEHNSAVKTYLAAAAQPSAPTQAAALGHESRGAPDRGARALRHARRHRGRRQVDRRQVHRCLAGAPLDSRRA